MLEASKKINQPVINMMKKNVLLIAIILGCLSTSFAQNPAKILEEGILMYKLEKASWYSTDHFLENFREKTTLAGGYVSYQSDKNSYKTIFYSKTKPYQVLATYSYDSLPTVDGLSVDGNQKPASDKETALITIREAAMEDLSNNSKNFYTFYKNTSPNLIPLIAGKEKKVIILTGPQTSGKVIIGNDYLLTFNKKNRLVKREKIHNSMLEFPYNPEDAKREGTDSFHSHIVTSYISSTDICTLLLYQEFANINQHYVISKKHVSIFNLAEVKLSIISRSVWDAISKAQPTNNSPNN